MAEYSANAPQIVNPGESIVFDSTVVPCNRGLIRHRDETGNFLLSGYSPSYYMCPCMSNNSATYLVDFGANISVPTGSTPASISLALVVD